MVTASDDFENPLVFHSLLKWILLDTNKQVSNETRK